MTTGVEIPTWVREYYECVDANDIAGCAERFADDIELQFGSRPVARGKAQVGRTLAAVHEPWIAVTHEVRRFWEDGTTALIEFAATYDLKAGGTRTIPTFSVLCREGDLISALRVYVDEGSLR